jgi:DNA-binding CsgD family transcriptional regulator
MSTISLPQKTIDRVNQVRKFIAMLTPSEQAVLDLAIQGESYNTIAQLLHKSPSTIGNQVQSMINKARQVYGDNTTFKHHVIFEVMLLNFLAENFNVTL